MFVLGHDLPDSIKELQKYFGDGTSNDVTNAFYKFLRHEHGMCCSVKHSVNGQSECWAIGRIQKLLKFWAKQNKE